ncbi:MAG: PAS domain S-box protein, partial [Desulfobacterales bacterium]|nr:PAS domain S-box protein [Desulfobacterales bacterium]
MRLGVKLLIAFLAVGLVPLMIIGILSLYEANRTLSQQSLNQLVSLREVKKFAVKRYFNNIKTQLLVFSEDPKVAEFMRKSRFFFTGYKTDLAVTDEAMEKMRRELLTTYMKDFVEVLSASDGSELNTLKEAFSKLDGNAIVIQYKYITENENPLKKKEILNRAKEDRTDYTRYHGKFHSTIRNYYKRFAIDDILLIDPDNGNIVYSVQKNIDFGTSLKDGPWAGTKLAEVLQTEMKRPEKESVLLVDYSLYLPAFDTPVGFFATPIFYKNEIIGIAAFRLSVDGINKIMVERAGLGKTGETYLVGSDGLLRSDSKNRGVKDSFRNPELNKMDTIATAAALSGENGAEITDDYMKRRVLCAYSALKIHGLNWALIAQKNLDEAFAMVDRLRFRFMLLATGGFIVILSIVFFISRSIIRPLRRLEHNAEQLSIGNLNETIDTGRRDELGSLARSFAYMRENLKNSFELIDDQKGQYQSIFENAIEGIFQTSRDGDLLRANQAYTKMLGYNSPEEMIKTISNVKEQLYVNPLDRDNFTELLEETGFVKGFETTHKRKDGSIITVSINAQVINDENGNFRFFQGMIEDISERKRVEEYKIAKEAAELANRVKSEFLAKMSHELRTPLNAIIGYSEMLLEDSEASGQKDFIADLQKIRESGQHLLALINDILDLSKIEADKMELYLETFDVSRMIKEVVSTIQPLADKNGNTLRVHCGDNLGTMRSDVTKVRQVLFNLLSNACKFTERGTISLDVFRETVDGSDWLSFGVSDTGIGMTEEQMERLFQAFSQAETVITRNYGGTGLGLAISKGFCQMLGGD